MPTEWPITCPNKDEREQIDYKIEKHPNPHYVTIHLDAEVPLRWFSGDYEMAYDDFRGGNLSHAKYAEPARCPFAKAEPEPDYLTGFFNIEGLKRVGTDRFEIRLLKAEAFDWKDILPAALAHIAKWLKADKAVEIPIEITLDDVVVDAAEAAVADWALDDVVSTNDPELIDPAPQADAIVEAAEALEEAIPFAAPVEDDVTTVLAVGSTPPASEDQSLPSDEPGLRMEYAEPGNPCCEIPATVFQIAPAKGQLEVLYWLPQPTMSDINKAIEYVFPDGSRIWKSANNGHTHQWVACTFGALLYDKEGTKIYFDTPEAAARELAARNCGPWNITPPHDAKYVEYAVKEAPKEVPADVIDAEFEVRKDESTEQLTESDKALLKELEAPVEKKRPIWVPKTHDVDHDAWRYQDGSVIFESARSDTMYFIERSGHRLVYMADGTLRYFPTLRDAATWLYELGCGPAAEDPTLDATVFDDKVTVADLLNVPEDGRIYDVRGGGRVMRPNMTRLPADLDKLQIWLPEYNSGLFTYPDGSRIRWTGLVGKTYVIESPEGLTLTRSQVFTTCPLESPNEFASADLAVKALMSFGMGPAKHSDPKIKIWLPPPNFSQDYLYSDGSEIWKIADKYTPRISKEVLRDRMQGAIFYETPEEAAAALAIRGAGPARCYDLTLPAPESDGRHLFSDGSFVRKSYTHEDLWCAVRPNGDTVRDGDPSMFNAMRYPKPELAVQALADLGFGPAAK